MIEFNSPKKKMIAFTTIDFIKQTNPFLNRIFSFKPSYTN